ncbi:MAG: gfo/Idh/MocA family oxidoreductase, partial [Clostridia bacterium]|nr:gfo/Idh/MocA family oxidoreductase [Clostridia bacterium]
MKDRIKIGVIGLGKRGWSMLKNPIIPMKKDGIDVVAVCDKQADRVDTAVKMLIDSGAEKPFATTDYKEVLALEGIDAVY